MNLPFLSIYGTTFCIIIVAAIFFSRNLLSFSNQYTLIYINILYFIYLFSVLCLISKEVLSAVLNIKMY